MRRLFDFARRTLPTISRTERIALESGTPGVEKHAFAGTLDHQTLSRYTPRPLTDIDRTMLDRAPALLRTVQHDILRQRQTPADHPFWEHARPTSSSASSCPREHGGMPMSSSGLSRLLQRLSSCSASVPVHVMVPASLGPAELLAHYGTEQQKATFLPELARGAIPCFGLTSADAGSDAAGSMTDTGTAFVDTDGEVRIRLECRKRYITLAPVADLVGLAFKLDDREGLLEALCGRPVDGEITLALLRRGAQGLELGPRTDPLGIGFSNGTVVADGAVISVDDVIGGEAGLGEGWKYLMEALAAGRGIALPAGANGSSKMLCNAVGGYAALREQFKVPISRFEGVQEKLADMAYRTYEIDSLVALMNCALDDGERPPVLSAILKQRSTELSRGVVAHAMDIVAGSAICMGDQNFVAPAYLSNPVGITVEGSNTMTRSLLIFGQGVVRSHPRLLALLGSIEGGDTRAFGREVAALVRDSASLLATATSLRTPLQQYVNFFALSSNASLLLGGELKRREFLSGRYADLLSGLIAGFAMEWHGKNQQVDPRFLRGCHAELLHRLDRTARELVRNHPHRALHRALLWKCAPGRQEPASDADRAHAAALLSTHGSSLRELFARDTLALHPNVSRIEAALATDDPDLKDALRREIVAVDVTE